MTKQRKKLQLKQDYCMPVAGDQEPLVPSKSTLVHVMKVFFICPLEKKGWGCLTDDALFEKLGDYLGSAAVTPVVFCWCEMVKKLPTKFPLEKKLRALQGECELLQYLFPKPGEEKQEPLPMNCAEVRELVVADAIEFLTKRGRHCCGKPDQRRWNLIVHTKITKSRNLSRRKNRSQLLQRTVLQITLLMVCQRNMQP